MDPRLQSSFIPKKPILETGSSSSSSSISPFLLISIIVFIIVLALCGGIFGFNKFQEKSIGDKQAELQKAESEFPEDLITKLSRLDERIKTAFSVLDKHVAVSQVFNTLEDMTNKSVRFTEMQYIVSALNIPSLALKGEAKSFNAVAFQSDTFSNNANIKQPLFSDIHIDDTGNILFNVSAEINPSSILYKKLISGASAGSAANPAQ